MGNKPRIRFKGFTEDWEQRKLSDILKVNSGKDYKHLDQGNIPVYGTGGYMLSVNESLSNIDAIGIGRKGTIDKPQYLKAPFWTVDTLFYLTALDKHSILFLYYLMQLIPWKKFDESTGVPSLSKTTIDNISGFVPSNSQEEELISALFNQLEKSITLHQCKLEKLKLTKKALLQKLFPKNGKHIPEIRFKGFTDAWEQRKLIDIAKTFIGLVTTMTENYRDSGTLLIRNSDIKEGQFVFSEKPIHLDEEFAEKNKTRRLQIGDVVTVHTGDIGTSAVIQEKEAGAIGFATINTRTDKRILNPYFLSTYFNTEKHKCYANSVSTGDGRSNYNIKDFNKLVISIPTLDEQEKISVLINNINTIITLHQCKLERLQEVKKGLLQKMFV